MTAHGSLPTEHEAFPTSFNLFLYLITNTTSALKGAHIHPDNDSIVNGRTLDSDEALPRSAQKLPSSITLRVIQLTRMLHSAYSAPRDLY